MGHQEMTFSPLSVLLFMMTFEGISVGARGLPEFVVCSVIVNGTTLPYDYRQSASAIQMALETVALKYNNTFQLKYVYVDGGTECAGTRIGAIASELYYTNNVSAFIGPGCSYAVEILGYMAASWNLPLISPVATKSSLANKRDFNTLTRLSHDLAKFAKFYRKIFEHFQWEHIAVIYDTNNVFSRLVGLSVHPDFIQHGLLSTEFPYNMAENPDLDSILNEAKKVARVFIMSSHGDIMRELMLLAKEKGMTNGEYCFIYIWLFEGDALVGDPSWQRADAADKEAREAYESVLMVTLAKPHNPEFQNFTNELKRRALSEYNYDYGTVEVNNFIVGFHEAFLVYAQVLNDTLKEGGDPYDGRAITRRMWNQSFEGISGRITIDDNGDRDMDFSLLDLDPVSGEFRVVGNYFGSNRSFSLASEAAIHWPNGGDPPPDVPRCGFLGDAPHCNPFYFPTYAIIALAFSGILIVVVIGSIFVYRRMKLEADLESSWWRVRWAEVHLQNKSFAHSFMSLSRPHAFGPNILAMDEQQPFAHVGTYKGNLVAIKRLPLKTISINRGLKMEFKQMRDLSHPNLVKFVGIATDAPSVCILTEFCPKGSLKDILSNPSIKLNWEFKLSLLTDICQGMMYLHQSSLGVHGHLTSSNCVIDSRFVLKLTDYGLLSFKADADPTGHNTLRKQLWVAPEFLRQSTVGTSQKGDVYSFGIIAYEVWTRQDPYEGEMEMTDISEILEKIVIGGSVRPSLREAGCKPEMCQLIDGCWDEDPQKRPPFNVISRALKSQSGREGSLLDSLLRRMENYANNLEHLVEERTQAFLEEKKKSEMLLYQVLPQSVANQLKNGLSVAPEAFQCVTIYFSDICGFTKISAASSPIQIVDLLNDLYTCFDSTIDKFDVYKVETIGDSYMVVSGLPLKNGTAHVREISLMSLTILEQVKHFKIRHNPNEPLRCRIGVHSGPVCAGVVGLKMPRYCLFGDTVNTASRMESHGEPLKIHTSESTKTLLDSIGGFHLELRGEIDVKGKGKMNTYWLMGRSP